MFTKNIKLIGIVALIVVIVMVLSAVIAINNDKKVATELGSAVEGVNGSVNNAKKEYEDKIAALQAAIDSLKGELADAKDVIAKLEEAGVKLENWDAASAVMLEKIAAANKVMYSYLLWNNGDAEQGIAPTLAFSDLYGYLATENATATEYFKGYFTVAEAAIQRATSVEEMDAIIADLAAAYDAIPTHYEAIYATFEAIEADEVTYDDYANIKLVTSLMTTANLNLFAPAETAEDKSEYTVLSERLDAINEEFVPIVVDNVMTLIAALPKKAETVRMSHYTAIEAAVKEGMFLQQIVNAEQFEELEEDDDFVEARTHAMECVAKLMNVAEVYAAAEELNEVLANAVKEGGILADGIKADVATRDDLVVLYGYVAEWVAFATGEGYGYDLDPESDDFDTEVASYYDATILAGYEAKLAAAAGDMAKYANEFITLVGALKVTNESEADLKACDDSYKAFIDTIGNLKSEDVDYILFGDREAEDGVHAAWLVLNAQQEKYNDICEIIKSIKTLAGNVVFVCSNDHEEDEECDCENLGEINWAVVATLDLTTYEENLARLLGNYGLEETVLDADAVAIYKQIRVYAAKQAALARLAAVHAVGSVDYVRYAGWIEEDAKRPYTLEAELVCTCPEDSEEECECDVYKLVDGAAIKALEAYFPVTLQ